MSWWTWTRRRLRVLFDKESLEHEMDEEMRFHLEMEIRQHVAAGVDPKEARRRALVAFGGVERHKEEARDVRGARILDDLVQDTRIALRSFAKQPGFVVTAVATLGIGIGGSVAMFGVLEASLFQSLPYPDSEELVLGRVTRSGQSGWVVSGRDWIDYRAEADAFASLAAVTPFDISHTAQGVGDAHRVRAMYVSPEIFATLGVTPLIGRDFVPEDGHAGAEPTAMLDHAYWERWHGSDPELIGQALSINGLPVRVAGVLPPDFRVLKDVDVYPVFHEDERWATARQFHNFLLIGRLGPGGTVGGAQAEVDGISGRLAEAYPRTNEDKGLELTPLREALIEDYRTVLGMLVAAVALVLLIACANVAGLLLARGNARAAELSVRSVMGAGRGRLGRQLLTENAILALGAGAVGIALATWLQRGIVAFVSMDQLGPIQPGLSASTLAFGCALCFLTVLGFGAIPAWRVARVGNSIALRGGTRATSDRSSTAFRRALVIGQVALTVVLLAGSGLLVRSFTALRAVDPGFDTERLLTAEVTIPNDAYPDDVATTRFFAELIDRLEVSPAVSDVGLATLLPIRDPGNDVSVSTPDAYGLGGEPTAFQRSVWPGYFDAMGIQILAGRDVERTDTPGATSVIVLSEQAASSVFGDDDPIGRTVAVDVGRDEPELREVVGIVSDIVTSNLEWGVSGAMYYPFHQRPSRSMRLAVRSSDAEATIASIVREELRALDPGVPLSAIATMDDVISGSVADRKAVMTVIGLFSSVAVLLALVGLYGVLAYQVTRRRREIGVRIALGAQRDQVARGVLRSGLRLAGIGLAVGVVAAVGATTLMQSWLYEVGSLDPITYLGVAVFVFAVTSVACFVPARRATRVDPVMAFRGE
ncbi:MAG: ABC transporter permease [Gemmatimonadota bacterium]